MELTEKTHFLHPETRFLSEQTFCAFSKQAIDLPAFGHFMEAEKINVRLNKKQARMQVILLSFLN